MTKRVDNPYVGPRSFERDEADRFYGREQEANELRALVMTERLVMFYAQSGAGKSSLINTRLIPQLQTAGFAVLPVGRVAGELPPGVEQVDNIFIFNLLRSLDHGDTVTDRFSQMTLSHFLAHLTSDDGERYIYDDRSPFDAPEDNDLGPRLMLIIDQFEEIVTHHLDHWPEREGFFRQLNQAMTDDPQLWVVLTLREDHIAALEPYAPLLRDKMRARYYMERMKTEAAVQAIKLPAQDFGRPFAPDVAETLVDNLSQIRIHGQPETVAGQYVEPVQLQLVCYQLWENLKGRAVGKITEQDFQEAGDVDSALTEFYEQAIQKSLQETGISEIELRNWFDQQLITEAGTRGTVYQGASDTAGLPNQVIKSLTSQFLLRAEIRAGGTWYELVHDRFVEPILQANRTWWQRQSLLIRAAWAWEESGRSKGKLYLGQQLKDALASVGQSQPEPLVAEFLAASEVENQIREYRRKILEQEAKARRKLARDLHDGPTQSVAAITMRLDDIKKLTQNKDLDKAVKELAKVQDIAQRTIREMRTMLFTMRPVILETQGLVPALNQFAERLNYNEAFTVNVTNQGYDGQLNKEAEGAVFAIIEEAVGNAKKHAYATRIAINLIVKPDGLFIEIRDNGVGFDVKTLQSTYDGHTFLGLINMDERAEYVGGQCTVKSAPDKGTGIYVQIPFTQVSEDSSSDTQLNLEKTVYTARLEKAIDTIKKGNLEKGRRMLEEMLEIGEISEDAWLWLSFVVDTNEDRKICLENVLSLNPDNVVAQISLKRLIKEEGLV